VPAGETGGLLPGPVGQLAEGALKTLGGALLQAANAPDLPVGEALSVGLPASGACRADEEAGCCLGGVGRALVVDDVQPTGGRPVPYLDVAQMAGLDGGQRVRFDGRELLPVDRVVGPGRFLTHTCRSGAF
jgi:hypothetical protein